MSFWLFTHCADAARGGQGARPKPLPPRATRPTPANPAPRRRQTQGGLISDEHTNLTTQCVLTASVGADDRFSGVEGLGSARGTSSGHELGQGDRLQTFPHDPVEHRRQCRDRATAVLVLGVGPIQGSPVVT